MEIKLKSVLKIRKQPLLLAVRALLFSTSLWLLADREFSGFQLIAFIIIGAVLYFIPVFQTLLVFPSFLTLMIIGPIAMSVFGSQVAYPSLLAGFFGLLFYIILGIKQVVFLNRLKLHHTLHLGLFYFMSILFFAAPGEDLFVIRSLSFAALSYLLLREFFLIRGFTRNSRLRLMSALGSFVIVEGVWVLGLLPIGFINAAGALLVLLFIIEELLTFAHEGRLNKRLVLQELTVFVLLLITIFSFSTWSLP